MTRVRYLMISGIILLAWFAAPYSTGLGGFLVQVALTYPILVALRRPDRLASGGVKGGIAIAAPLYLALALVPQELHVQLIVKPLCGGMLCSEGLFYGNLLANPVEYFNWYQATTGEIIAVQILYLACTALAAIFLMKSSRNAEEQALDGSTALNGRRTPGLFGPDTVRVVLFLAVLLAAIQIHTREWNDYGTRVHYGWPFEVSSWGDSTFDSREIFLSGVLMTLTLAYGIAFGATVLFRRLTKRTASEVPGQSVDAITKMGDRS
jgi:hypothetical protein